MINFGWILQKQRLEADYWHKVKTLAFDTVYDNRDVTDKELHEGIALAICTNRNESDFVKDYWTEYWDIHDFVNEYKLEVSEGQI